MMTRTAARRMGQWGMSGLGILVVLAVGCGPRMKMLTDKHYEPRPASRQIEIYQGKVETPHDNIAIIDSRGFEELTSDTRKTMVDDLRERARRVGADAVTNVQMLIAPERGFVPDPQTPFKSVRQGWTDVHFLRGTAIRYKPLMIETEGEGSGVQQLDYGPGEEPALKAAAPGDLEISPTTDGQGRKGWTSRRTKPTKPRLPSVETGG